MMTTNNHSQLEIYQFVETLQKKVSRLEAEKQEFIKNRNQEVEQQVNERTQELRTLLKQEQLLTQITARIRATLDLENILQTTVTEIREFLDCDRMVVFQFDSDSQGQIVAESLSNLHSILRIGIVENCSFYKEFYSYFSDKKIRSISNIYELGYSNCYISFLEKYQVKATVIVPIYVNNQSWGLLIGHQCDQFRQWQNTEINFLENVAEQLAIAIHQAQLYQQKQEAETSLRQLNEQLEAKVKQRTQELQEREARLQKLFDNAPDLIQSVAADGRILFVNKTWRNILGYTEADLKSLSIFEVIHPDHYNDCKQVITSIQNGMSSVNKEVNFLTKDGRTIWVEGNVNGIFQDGKLIATEGIFREITERKQADEKLRQTLKELSDFKFALDQAALVAITDEKGVITYANDRFCEISQYSQEDLIGQTHSIINSGYHPPEFFTDLWQTISRGKVWRGEIKNKAKDGSFYWVDSTIVPFLNSKGKPFQYLAIRNDITQRKQIEEALKQKLAAIEASIDGIAILAEDTYTYLNQAHLKLLGYQHPEELLGKSWRELYSPTELQRLEQEVFPILMQRGHWRGEATAQRKDGSTFTEELSLTFTEDEKLICVCQDISERKEAEKQLRQTNERLELTNLKLERATRAKDEFLANMSHELRTPLNAIIGMSEGLQEEVFGSLNEDQQKAIGIIEISGQHLLDLINDILDLSKIEAGKIELEITSVSLQELIDNSLIFIRQQAIKKQIKLKTEISSELDEGIYIDERRMRQALINLLSNAIKFTPEKGQVTLLAELEKETTTEKKLTSNQTQEKAYSLKISVRDTGIGIAPENIKKLFKPFVQLDSRLNRQYTGTGLGLALVRQIVELHGGRVTVTSQLGEGSCFTIHLPYTPQCKVSKSQKITSVSHSQSWNLESQSPPQKSSPLLLLAEDNQANIDTVSDYLTSYNYQLLIAKNGREAVEMAKKSQPNLILMDIQMPEMDGLEAIREIRTDSSLTQVPIIAVTALAMAGDVEKCREAGANEYMTKPLKLKQLLGMIQNLLNSDWKDICP
ncbi:MAG: PAS domain S-box protein [Lyngbya sp.]|nr:PAS domain S-box protein [Lyngbya sp.]